MTVDFVTGKGREGQCRAGQGNLEESELVCLIHFVRK